MALMVRLARSSKAPAQPTQSSHSTSSGIVSPPSSPTTRTGKSTSLIQALRVEAFMPHGLPLLSRFLNSPPSSVGNCDSTSTW